MENRLKAATAALGGTLVKKRRSYGRNIELTGVFLKELFPSGVPPAAYGDLPYLVRMLDKLARLAHHAGKPDRMKESPYKDLAGYSILGQLSQEDEFRRQSEARRRKKEEMLARTATGSERVSHFTGYCKNCYRNQFPKPGGACPRCKRKASDDCGFCGRGSIVTIFLRVVSLKAKDGWKASQMCCCSNCAQRISDARQEAEEETTASEVEREDDGNVGGDETGTGPSDPEPDNDSPSPVD